METMLDKGLKEHMDSVAKILEALLLHCQVEEAIIRTELLLHNGCAPNVDKLLNVLCEETKTIAALKLLDFCWDKYCIIDFSNYEKVLDSLVTARKTLSAYSILRKIVEKGGTAD
ncbi:hypothetical protein DCAR_0415836 [Daucus carota subsp. sativus]|uniref:Uncharacterized protein n=1 Tax=Daucus carota subsp. sativus TaxID=79200 RepID=A0A162A9V2_DAUCS|nr:hypothetical protein DCAR_0415836 [Daucus carota subsp. sativus]